jgi:hypothetical protein
MRISNGRKELMEEMPLRDFLKAARNLDGCDKDLFLSIVGGIEPFYKMMLQSKLKDEGNKSGLYWMWRSFVDCLATPENEYYVCHRYSLHNGGVARESFFTLGEGKDFKMSDVREYDLTRVLNGSRSEGHYSDFKKLLSKNGIEIPEWEDLKFEPQKPFQIGDNKK